MIEQLALPIVIATGILCYIVIIMALPKHVTQGRSQHLRMAMQRLEEQQKRVKAASPTQRNDEILEDMEEKVLVRAFMALPGSQSAIGLVEQAGMIAKLDKVILSGIILLLVLCLLLGGMNVTGIIISFVMTFLLMRLYLTNKISKRRKLFLSLLPDALEIIVRSVKSGYPINTAIGMVADSLPPEVGEEWLRIVHEASFGYSLGEAVTRFAERMDEPDVHFFAVVVNIQQESGGNIAEVIGNLSSVIRQRQQLKLKIRALSSEGRMTVVILVGIAICMVGAVQFLAPGHFDRLFQTSAGHTIISIAAVAFTCAYLVIKKIINFKI